MALQFFRRRQKMVIAIMVILMVSFLVGGAGLSSFLRRDVGRRSVGVSKFGKLRRADLVAAANDLNLLGALNYRARDLDYGAVIANGDSAAVAYALLQKEASKAPLVVTEQDVDAYLGQRNLGGAHLDSLLDQLRSRMPGINRKRLRETVKRWIRVTTLFYRSVFFAACPARLGATSSEQQMRHLYRDLAERIDLRIAVVKAEDYLQETAEPDDAEIQAQLERYRNRPRGRASQDNPFGFGYLQPDRTVVRYMLIRQDVIQRVVRPSEQEVRAHYIQYRGRYVKTDPSAQATSAAAAQPMTFTEAKPLIVQELAAAAVRGAMDDLASHVMAWIDQYATETRPTVGDAYDYALQRIKASAEPVLARELSDLDIRAQPLAEAVAALAEKAGLTAIAFPWGQQGPWTAEPDVKVTLKADRMTLGEALASICAQLKWPELSWATARPLPGVLFSVADDDGVDFFPIQVHDTAPMDRAEMLSDEVLGHSRTAVGELLVWIVFTAQPFQPGGRGVGMKLGDDGPRMLVSGPRAGRLLWRLVGAEPAHEPQRLEDVPGLAEQVASDIRIAGAFQQALEEAQRLQERASKVGLAAAAKRARIETFDTGLFARKTEVYRLREYEALARLSGRGVSLAELAVQEPVIYPFTDVEGLELASSNQKQTFMDAAFTLVPEEVEPPYPSSPPATGLVALPLLRQVVVMERMDYEPPVASEYAQAKPVLAGQLEAVGLWRGRVTWFALSSIARRARFVLPAREPTPAAP